MPLVDLVMPKLGESIMEATILKWHKQVGDAIQLDETLLDIATDKVDSEVPSTVGGIVKEILFEINAVVPIGAVIARIETGDKAAHSKEEKIAPSQVAATTPAAPAPTSVPASAPSQVPAAAAEAPVTSAQETVPFTPNTNFNVTDTPIIGEPKFYSPLVLSIAQNEGIGLNELQFINGTGNEGRVTKKDILNYIAAKKSGVVNIPAPMMIVESAAATTKSKPLDEIISEHNSLIPISTNSKYASPDEVVITGNTEIVEMDRMRKLIAKHMVDSVQTSPHVTSFVEADVTNMVVWREKVKQLFEKREGTKLTYTPMFLEVIAATLEKFPIINASLQGDQIVYKKDINVGMATALPSGNLIVPVIKGANQLSIVGITKAVNNLANAARNNQLKPTDTMDGTFTVTNVGTFGSIMGTPIINQPQVAILALGAIKKRPVVIETPAGDAIAIRHIMYLSMSYDHRIVDGAIGSQFLAAVAKGFENWDVNRQWFQYV